jgi:hypothetical protein
MRHGDDRASWRRRRWITILAVVALVVLGAGMAFGRSAFESQTAGYHPCPYEHGPYGGHDAFCHMAPGSH